MSEVLVRTEGRAGRITLNRPAQLNALTPGMVAAIDAALAGWAADPSVAVVMIDAAGPRAFCAGGDVAVIYHAARAGDTGLARAFWRAEYRMNARIAAYPKPVVTFLHGFVMGGGVGLGCHAAHRILGESTRVAMPECAIGLVPDVGGTHLLARAPGRTGEWLGLAGVRMGPALAIAAGFGDRFVPEAEWERLKARLAADGDAGCIAEAPAPPPDAPPEPGWTAGAFAGAGIAAIRAALSAEAAPAAAAAAAALDAASPLALEVTLRLVRAAREAPGLQPALTREYRATCHALEHGDFLEGVRAQVIDKDRRPRWRHAGPAAVPEGEVAAALSPRPDDLQWEETA
ncbi:MAG: enoyl-CoA hydratase/isomerase family protein [Rhodobacteraceae bacterium]|nr:enoyl-CoA hydratase/isomerase family protein [Paracoccaceae bacterium]